MDTESPGLSPRAITAAIEGNLYAFGTTQFAKWPQIEVYDEPQLLWFMCDVPSPMFNVIHRARWERVSEARQGITALQNSYGERGLPMLWWIGPSSTPLDLSRHLTDLGFLPAGETTGMALDLHDFAAPPPPAGVTIEVAGDADSMALFARTMCAGFQAPPTVWAPMTDLALAMDYSADGPLLNYIGYDDGRPVATSTLFFGAGVAGIYNVSTVPEARRRGIGTALTAAALVEAAKRGHQLAILHSSTAAYSMYRRLGFAAACYFHEYLWPAPT
jgi:ribosomal protein S18 acetylase RimI-like enzyme